MNRRFVALRVSGTILKILAWTLLILGLLVALVVVILGFTLREPLGMLDLASRGPLIGVAGFVLVLTVAIVLFLALYSAGEFLAILLSIEESGRRTAYLLQQQYLAQQQPQFPGSEDDEIRTAGPSV